MQTPAVNAIFPDLVPKEKLTKVQGINQSMASISLLLAPAIGGVILGWLGLPWALMVDVATAALAISVLYRIRLKQRQPVSQPGGTLTDIALGFRYAFGHRQLRPLLICYGCAFFLMAIIGKDEKKVPWGRSCGV